MFERFSSPSLFAIYPKSIDWHGQNATAYAFPAHVFFFFLRLSFFRDRDLDLGFELGFDLDDEELEEDIGEE